MPDDSLDAPDRRILNEIQRNARISNVELATRVGLSPSPCLARVRALEHAGVIDRYVTLLNPAAIGLNISVFIRVSLDRQVEAALERFDAAVQGFSEVMECYLMSGESDYLLRVVVADIQELQIFITDKLAKTPGVANIQSSFALKQVKYNTALPVPPLPAPKPPPRRRADNPD